MSVVHTLRVEHSCQERSIGESAAALAAIGFYVFPLHTPISTQRCSCGWPECCSVGKHPRLSRGFYSASHDPRQIDQWWHRWPEANIGIPCGASGIVVLDYDPHSDPDGTGRSRFDEFTDNGYTVYTGGGGLHEYFRTPAGVVVRNSGGKLGPGIDVRGDGGYIVAPPSLHRSGKRYTWVQGPTQTLRLESIRYLPPSVLQALTQPNDVEPRVRAHRTTSHAINNDVDAALARGCIPAGSRNSTLTSLAGTLRRYGLSVRALEAALLKENETRCVPSLPVREVLAIARSVSRYPSGLRS